MEEFKEGDVVTLKSGGPKMTVAHIQAGAVYVTWFSENEVSKSSFKSTMLNKVV